MKETQFSAIAKWQNETFPHATALSKLAHLQQETKELIDDLKLDNKDKRLEWADNLILLFGAAASDGMTYEDICNSIEEKMQINKNRSWGKPDENGVVNHLK